MDQPTTPGIPAIFMQFSLPRLSMIIPLKMEAGGMTTMRTLAKIIIKTYLM